MTISTYLGQEADLVDAKIAASQPAVTDGSLQCMLDRCTPQRLHSMHVACLPQCGWTWA